MPRGVFGEPEERGQLGVGEHTEQVGDTGRESIMHAAYELTHPAIQREY
ncbi:hypothetical protein ACFQX6_50820 [Streptosporangium lutulentum]